MGLCELYSTSEPFMDTVRAAVARVDAVLERPVRLAHIVTLPALGQRVILRFALAEGEISSFAEADALEVRLRDLARASSGRHWRRGWTDRRETS